jgi:transposase InsO family protein
LECSGLARSTYHYHRARAKRFDKYAFEREAVTRIFSENRARYGYRRIALALRLEEGLCLSGKTVAKLMREEGLYCLVRRKKYRSYRGEVGAAAPHLLQRDFSADRPGLKWVTDVTEFRVAAAKVYLSPVIDLFNGEVISYSVSSSPNMRMVLNMVGGALGKLRPGDRPILHSDQGWQYRHSRYRRVLELNGITQSMSRKGNCLDNACAENFFGHLK